MAATSREHQKIFCDNVAATDNVAQFGSLKAAAISYTKDIATLQALDAFIEGWKSAVVTNNAPALQDMNALFFLITRQLSYLFESGVPEWHASETYYTGNLVRSGVAVYRSVANDNINHAVTDSTYWVVHDNDLTWKSTVTYSLYSIASDAAGTSLYVSLADDNTNNALSDATKWKPIVQNGQQTGISAGSSTCDCQLYNTFVKTGSNSATNIGLNNMVDGQTVTVLISSVSSQAAITWKRGTDSGGTADIRWNNAVVPTPTTTASRYDRYIFQKINGVIYGSADMNCY